MKNKEQIIIQQKEFIKKMENAAVNFIDSIDKSQIETILLSGSVARGDYFPQKNENGEDEGMIDLIVMKKDGSSITAEDRMVYYSLSLEKLPKNYENFILELKNQTTDSLENYKMREELFKTNFLSFLEKNK